MPASLREIVSKSIELKEAVDLVEKLLVNRQTAMARAQQAQDALTAATQELQTQVTIATQLRDQLKDLVNQP